MRGIGVLHDTVKHIAMTLENPFGFPVDPDVYRMYAIASGETARARSSDEKQAPIWSRVRTGRVPLLNFSAASRFVLSVRIRLGCECSTIVASLISGNEASSGTYHLPAFSTHRVAPV